MSLSSSSSATLRRPGSERRPRARDSRRRARPTLRYGAYEVVAEIDRGGMGAVHRVRHRQTGVLYALKVIRPELLSDDPGEAVARFRRESELLARIPPHPGLIRIFSAGMERGELFYVMELVEGRSLDDELTRGGALPPIRAARMVARIARAVDHAHRHGVLHRDLKPANVVIDASGEPRLLDFGLARDLAGPRGLTATGQILGTPGFMAPEQIDEAAAGAPVSRATDVYGLGAILYALLTAQAPFIGRSSQATMAKVLLDEPPPPSTVAAVPPTLEAICLRAIARRAGDRYGSALELARTLERGAGRGRPDATGSWREPARRRQRRGLWAAAIGVVALAGIGTGAILARRSGATRGATGPGATGSNAEAGERAGLDAELRVVFRRAIEGDGAALARGLALCGRLRAAGEAGLIEDHEKVLLALAALERGEPIALAPLPDAVADWDRFRGPLVRALLGDERRDAVAWLVDGDPTLLDWPEVADAAIAAVLDGHLEASAGRIERLLDADREPDETLRAERGRRLLVAGIARALQQPGGSDATERDQLIAMLLPRLRADGAIAPRLPAKAGERLAAITLDGLRRETISPSLRGLVEAAVLLERERSDPIIEAIGQEIPLRAFDGAKGGAFDLATIRWMVARPLATDGFTEAMAPPSEELLARAATLRAAGVDSDRAAELAAIGVTLIERDLTADRPGGADYYAPEARRASWRLRFPLFADALARERENGDLSAFVLGRIGAQLGLALDAAQEDAAFDRWFRAALADAWSGSPAAAEASIAELLERAWARSGALPHELRIEIVADAAIRVIRSDDPAAGARTERLALDGLDLAGRLLATPIRPVLGDQRRLATRRVEDLLVFVERLVETRLAREEPGGGDCTRRDELDGVLATIRAAEPTGLTAARLDARHHLHHARPDLALKALEAVTAPEAASHLGLLLLRTELLVAVGRHDDARASLARVTEAIATREGVPPAVARRHTALAARLGVRVDGDR